MAVHDAVMAAGAPPWPVVALLAISTVTFHNRCSATELHARDMARLRITETLAGIEAIKTRHGVSLGYQQSDLPLARGRMTPGSGGAGREGTQR